MSQLAKAVVAALAVHESKKRIHIKTPLTFFGEYDLWRYHAVFDIKLCDDCMRHAETHYFIGKYLRALFPYLEIQDQNTIKALVHPHCRCTLHRITDPGEYIMATSTLLD